jgi:phosphoenolpyruvate-protein phosphotransferase (PTS system enzyme I)
MEFKIGIPASPGIVIGEAFVLDHQHYNVTQARLRDNSQAAISKQKALFSRAVEGAVKEIKQAVENLQKDQDVDVTSILEFQVGTLENNHFQDSIFTAIDAGYSPAYGVQTYFRRMRAPLANIPMLADKITDLAHMERRVLRLLVGETQRALKDIQEPVILIAKDLDPTTTATLPLDKVLGIATDAGGLTSHTAIVAASRNIPAVVGLYDITRSVQGGEILIIDGRKGRVIVKPDEATLRKYQKSRKDLLRFNETLLKLRTFPAETEDGYEVRLHANIEFPTEISAAIQNGANGIGLYRTEFLYSENNPDPSEEVHYEAYKTALEALSADGVKDRPLVIRTLDLGADKFCPDIDQIEKNPFLGQRSIRWCFSHPDVFARQLRAILRVSTLGNVRIMLPMISSVEDLLQAKSFIEDAKDDLRRLGQSFNETIKIGIMIEVPSAAIIADMLAEHVDFFSIGTNDLVQYTLAVDRVNERVARYYRPAQPAIFRLLLRVVEVGRRFNKSVSLCGEISGSPNYTLLLLGLGLRELSMAPARVPNIKKMVRSLRMKEACAVAREIFQFDESSGAELFLEQKARVILPEFFS